MKYLLSLCIIFVVIACGDSSNNKGVFPNQISSYVGQNKITESREKIHKIKIDLSNTISGEFDDFFKLKKIIFLDNKSPIGTISTIKQFQDNLIILDKQNAKQLYCYDFEGNLIWEYKSKGGGPLEFKNISDFVINKKYNSVDVLDDKSYKIISLDISTGIPIKYHKLGVYATELELYDSDNYLLYTGNISVSIELDYKLLLYNFSTGIESKNIILEDYEKKILWSGFKSLNKNEKGELFFTEALNDTIYSVRNDTLKAKFYIDFKDKKYPKKLRENYSHKTKAKFQKNQPFISGPDLVRVKNGFLNFMFNFKGSFYTVFYDLNLKKTYLFSKLNNGKFSPGKQQQVLTQGYIEDGFINFIDPSMLSGIRKEILANDTFKDFLKTNRPELFEATMKTDDFSNPFLLIYEFKKIPN